MNFDYERYRKVELAFARALNNYLEEYYKDGFPWGCLEQLVIQHADNNGCDMYIEDCLRKVTQKIGILRYESI